MITCARIRKGPVSEGRVIGVTREIRRRWASGTIADAAGAISYSIHRGIKVWTISESEFRRRSRAVWCDCLTGVRVCQVPHAARRIQIVTREERIHSRIWLIATIATACYNRCVERPTGSVSGSWWGIRAVWCYICKIVSVLY